MRRAFCGKYWDGTTYSFWVKINGKGHISWFRRDINELEAQDSANSTVQNLIRLEFRYSFEVILL